MNLNVYQKGTVLSVFGMFVCFVLASIELVPIDILDICMGSLVIVAVGCFVLDVIVDK